MELGENNKNKDWRILQIQLSVLRETGRDFELLGLKLLQMAWSQPVVSLFTVWYRGQNLELLWLMLVHQNFDCWMFHKDISIGSYLAAKAPGPKKYGQWVSHHWTIVFLFLLWQVEMCSYVRDTAQHQNRCSHLKIYSLFLSMQFLLYKEHRSSNKKPGTYIFMMPDKLNICVLQVGKTIMILNVHSFPTPPPICLLGLRN